MQTILKITPFSNSTAEPDETTTYLAIVDDDDVNLSELIDQVQQNSSNAQGFTFFQLVFLFDFIHLNKLDSFRIY